jgi:hypothetical protein
MRWNRSLSATERLETVCKEKGLVLLWEGPARLRQGQFRIGLTLTRKGGAYLTDASLETTDDRLTVELRDDLAASLLSEASRA